MLVNISEIKVKHRIRKDLGDLEPLKDSLRRYGLLNPITIDSKNRLIAGERRLEAAKQIGWTNINAIIINNLTPVTKLELELEENNQRKEFTDAELLEGYKRLERLRNPGIFRRIINAIINFFQWIADSLRRLFK
ncbi:ParB N-terminal domain-containing protein [Treponema sp.]|uniref:ParB N-terminal domain-containing protein n=1 Tax=Treponema sp. TaxID=166 RepID=UPI00298DE8B0|nr:ParB N-terminal domain-containing protein [Treponema sp.]MCR5614405.1 ParB N-terminal domain-containing protein [Treponema sp.]